MREVWPGTFVEPNNLAFNISLLRKTLGHDGVAPVYIETVPKRGYRFIGALNETQIETKVSVADLPAPDPPPETTPKTAGRVRTAVIAGLFCLLGFGGAVLSRRSDPPDPRWAITRLTMSSSLDGAALSRDGTVVAYSADPASKGNRDLYLKHVGSDHALRLTFDGEGNTSPDFSPDGSKIVFHSDHARGGIYVMAAVGGTRRLLAPDGLNPKFAPDGIHVAYWVGGTGVADAVPGAGAVFVLSLFGGKPVRVAPHLASARYPIWFPEGNRLLLDGYSSAKAYDQSALDWWIARADGTGIEERTGAYAAFLAAGLKKIDPASDLSSRYAIPLLPAPGCWNGQGKLVFSASLGDSENLWQTEISKNKLSGHFNRVTTAGGDESFPACAGDTLAFTSFEIKRSIWLVPMDLDHGRATGALQSILTAPGFREYPSPSADGSRLLFTSAQSGRLNAWMYDRRTDQQSQVSESALVQRFGILNRSGTKAVFSVFEPNKPRSLYLSDLVSPPQKICEGCLRATDFSVDDSSVLTFSGDPYRVSELKLSSLQLKTIVEKPPHHLLYARFSPDYRWISFTERISPSHSRIFIAPIRQPWPVAEKEWIEISEESTEDWANWSPNGKYLYFTSARDGHICFWAQALDPATHRPVGKPFCPLHLHGPAFYENDNGWSLSRSSLAVVLNDDTGAVWMMSDVHKQ